MISSWLYAGYDKTAALAASLVSLLNDDPTPTAVIGITSLSGNYFPASCDPREDHIANKVDDTWNRRVINLCELGKFGQIDDLAGDYAKTCRVDVDFKVMAFLRGIGAAKEGKPAMLHEYQPICGTGAAVLQF
ncbi:MAG: hypothetical protein FJ146_17950 [Deltaproteobacteria bacterium]|nr:hypothetical protein [Deltaproteobacteria bacterium]